MITVEVAGASTIDDIALTLDGSRTATYALPAGLPVGEYIVSASYAGAQGYLPSNGSAGFEVALEPGVVSGSFDRPTQTHGGTPSTLTIGFINLEGVEVPSGSVVVGFQDSLAELALVNGAATWSAPVLTGPGEYTVTISYPGDGFFAPSSAQTVLTVVPAQAELTLDAPGSIEVGQSFVVSASVAVAGLSPAEAGPVVFSIDGEFLTERAVDGSGVVEVTIPAPDLPGGLLIEASVADSENVVGAAVSGYVEVTKGATSVELTAPETLYARQGGTIAVEVTASAAGAPEGEVRYRIDGTEAISIPLVDGRADISLPVSLAVGTYEIDVEYPGSAIHAASIETIRVDVLASRAPSFDIVVEDDIVEIGSPVEFSVIAFDPEGEPLDFTVDYGDGSEAVVGSLAEIDEFSHVYTRAGTFLVKVKVKDPDSAVSKLARVRVVLPELTRRWQAMTGSRWRDPGVRRRSFAARRSDPKP